MKRLHVNLGVDNIAASVDFYTRLFDAEPTVLKHDYARWMLEDPRVNFAISQHSGINGIDHLGIQAEDELELNEVYGRLELAGGEILDEGETTCCYSRTNKRWIKDPQGVAWRRRRSSIHKKRSATKPATPSPRCCG